MSARVASGPSPRAVDDLRTSCGRPGVAPGTTPRRPPNHTVVIRELGTTGTTRRGDTHGLRCGDDGLSPIHSPYYCYLPCPNTSMWERPHCEVPMRARGPRRRPGDGRAGGDEPHRHAPRALGPAPRGPGRRALGHRHRPRAVDPAHRRRRRRARRRGRRAGPPGRRHRALAAAGAVEFSVGDEEVSISAGRSQFTMRPLGLDDYPAQGEPAAEAVTLSSSAVGRGAAPGRAGREHRRRPGRAHRRADRRRGRRRADGGHRLVPPGRA